MKNFGWSPVVYTSGVFLAALFSGCTSIPTITGERYVQPMVGAAVRHNTTSYTAALDCLGTYLQQMKGKPARFAVGRVDDFSGKQDLINGKRITQGTALMVISALSRTRLPLVERLDTSIAEMELKYTDNKLIGDAAPQAEASFRKTLAGSVVGSDYHVIGGITEVNYNIRSGSLDATVSSIGASGRYAVLDVAIDLRLVNTRTLLVEEVVSFEKQIIGTEIRAGIFRFLSDSVIDVSAGDKAQEPIQKAVRMVAERAVYELISGLYKVPNSQCGNGTVPKIVTAQPVVLAPLSPTLPPMDNASAPPQTTQPILDSLALPRITEVAGLAAEPPTETPVRLMLSQTLRAPDGAGVIAVTEDADAPKLLAARGR